MLAASAILPCPTVRSIQESLFLAVIGAICVYILGTIIYMTVGLEPLVLAIPFGFFLTILSCYFPVAAFRGWVPLWDLRIYVSIFVLGSYSLPSFYHTLVRDFNPEKIFYAESILASNSEYGNVLLHSFLYFAVILILSGPIRRKVRGRIGGNYVPQWYALAAGGLLVALGLVGIMELNGGIDGYISKFAKLGIREPPPSGYARYKFMSALIGAGSQVVFLVCAARIKGKGRGVKLLIALLPLILLGGLDMYNTGGRGELAIYVLSWVMVIAFAFRNIRFRHLIIAAFVVAGLTIVVTNIRSVTTTTNQDMPSMAAIAGIHKPEVASNIRGRLFLLKDEVAPTVFAFKHAEGWRYATVVWAPLLEPVYAVGSLVGYNGLSLASTGIYGINNYNGIWLGRGAAHTNHSSSPVAEGYAFGGSIGVLLVGVLGAILVGISGRALARAWCMVGHGVPGERYRLGSSALWIPIVVNISLIIGANVVMGSPASIANPILFEIGPVWLLYAFGRFVLPAISQRSVTHQRRLS